MSGMTHYGERKGDRITMTLHDRRRAEHHARKHAENLLEAGEKLTLVSYDQYARRGVYRVEAAPPPRVEVLLDVLIGGGAEVRVWIDGIEQTGATVETVDSGAGHTRSEWREDTARVKADQDNTAAFRRAVLDARAVHAKHSPHITD